MPPASPDTIQFGEVFRDACVQSFRIMSKEAFEQLEVKFHTD